MEGRGSKTQSDCFAFSNCRYKNQGYRQCFGIYSSFSYSLFFFFPFFLLSWLNPIFSHGPELFQNPYFRVFSRLGPSLDGAVGNLRVSSVFLRDEIKEVVELWREGSEENHMLGLAQGVEKNSHFFFFGSTQKNVKKVDFEELSVWTLADCKWRAAAPELESLLLPRAPTVRSGGMSQISKRLQVRYSEQRTINCQDQAIFWHLCCTAPYLYQEPFASLSRNLCIFINRRADSSSYQIHYGADRFIDF